MAHRMELRNEEIVDNLGAENIAGSTIGYTMPPGIYEITDHKLMLKSVVPDKLKVKFAIDDIRLKTNLTTNKINMFTKKNLFLYKIRFYSIGSSR